MRRVFLILAVTVVLVPLPVCAQEIHFYAGEIRHTVNDNHTPSSAAWSVEYRRGLGRYVDWTIGWLDEGDDHRVYRAGPTTQFWHVRAFFDERVALGAGAGVHLDVTNEDPLPGDDRITTLAGLVSIKAAYRFTGPWLARLCWNRVVTDYDRDSDVIILGVGYDF